MSVRSRAGLKKRRSLKELEVGGLEGVLPVGLDFYFELLLGPGLVLEELVGPLDLVDALAHLLGLHLLLLALHHALDKMFLPLCPFDDGLSRLGAGFEPADDERRLLLLDVFGLLPDPLD